MLPTNITSHLGEKVCLKFTPNIEFSTIEPIKISSKDYQLLNLLLLMNKGDFFLRAQTVLSITKTESRNQ